MPSSLVVGHVLTRTASFIPHNNTSPHLNDATAATAANARSSVSSLHKSAYTFKPITTVIISSQAACSSTAWSAAGAVNAAEAWCGYGGSRARCAGASLLGCWQAVVSQPLLVLLEDQQLEPYLPHLQQQEEEQDCLTLAGEQSARCLAHG